MSSQKDRYRVCAYTGAGFTGTGAGTGNVTLASVTS